MLFYCLFLCFSVIKKNQKKKKNPHNVPLFMNTDQLKTNKKTSTVHKSWGEKSVFSLTNFTN